MRKDLKRFRIKEGGWFHVAQDREMWRGICKEGATASTEERLRKERSRRDGSPIVTGPTAT